MRLVFDNITKRYKTNAALSEVSLELSEGVYAFLGPNGAGKTTLMNILCGIIAPTSGKVTLDGKDTVSMDKDFRRLLGYLPQNPGFYPSFSGLELLRYFCSLKEVNKPSARIDEVLNFVNLYDERKKKYGEYSGGMKRRLGIAIAMLGDPKILVLDEPTAGLDPKERIRFRNIMSRIGRDKIIIYATHIVSDIESIADRVILLKSGEVIKFGSTGELLSSAEGKVWHYECGDEFASEYAIDRSNASVIKGGDKTVLKIISDDKPFDTAYSAAPTLEDVYMYYFNESGEGDAH